MNIEIGFSSATPITTATVIAYVGVLVGLVGGAVALFNSWIAVRWKRAELANSYLRDFNSNEELVFAGRCLDWQGGRIALPEGLRSYLSPEAKAIQHDWRLFAQSLSPNLSIRELDEDPRTQIYRTSMDSFLSWLCLVSSALERKLFSVEDIEEIGYWAAKIESHRPLMEFIEAYGYGTGIRRLIKYCRTNNGVYQRWWFSPT